MESIVELTPPPPLPVTASSPLIPIHQLLPRLLFLLKILTHPYSVVLIVPVLTYNIFIYIYLGILEQGTDFYRGFGLQYSLFYSAVAGGYWIVWIQSQVLKSSSNIIANEILENDMFKLPLCECASCPAPLWCLEHSTYFRLLKLNHDYLYEQEPENRAGYKNFIAYCMWWKTRIGWIFGIWSTIITFHVVTKVLPPSFLNLPESFDDRPIAFYGYFNLFSQYIAMLIIVTGGITMLIGFYQLRFIILEYTKTLRTQYMKTNRDPNPQLKKALRDQYLQIQKRSITVSFVWSSPVLLVLVFTTQIIISNVVLIHYSLSKCSQAPHTCGWIFMYPLGGLLGSLWLGTILLRNISKVNEATEMLKNIFVYSQNGDEDTQHYKEIGGRKSWISYLESNPISFIIGGVIITPDIVIKSGYTIITAIASIIMADLFG